MFEGCSLGSEQEDMLEKRTRRSSEGFVCHAGAAAKTAGTHSCNGKYSENGPTHIDGQPIQAVAAKSPGYIKVATVNKNTTLVKTPHSTRYTLHYLGIYLLLSYILRTYETGD